MMAALFTLLLSLLSMTFRWSLIVGDDPNLRVVHEYLFAGHFTEKLSQMPITARIAGSPSLIFMPLATRTKTRFRRSASAAEPRPLAIHELGRDRCLRGST